MPSILDGTISVHDPRKAQELMAAGAILERHAHQMRLTLPVAPAEPSLSSSPRPDPAEFHPFEPGGQPPVPWARVLPAFLAAYPPDHPDHLPGGEDLIDSYLIPYSAGARLGPPICEASAIAISDDHAYAGILVVDRPGEGAWVCDIWRDPDPVYAGAGTALLRWAAARLGDYPSLGLVVTVGNAAALRAYERAGFTIESTAWRLRLP